MSLIVVCLWVLLLLSCTLTQSSPLTSIRRGNLLNIEYPPFYDNPLEETIWFMKKYFYKRSLITNEKRLQQIKDQLVRSYDPSVVVDRFLRYFEDQYTRWIPVQVAETQRETVRGERIGVGLRLRRRFGYPQLAGTIIASDVMQSLQKLQNIPSVLRNVRGGSIRERLDRLVYAVIATAAVTTAIRYHSLRHPMKHALITGLILSLGVQFVLSMSYVTVTESYGPAQHAGVLPGDQLVKVNGKVCRYMSLGAIQRLLDEKGNHSTPVNMHIVRAATTSEGPWRNAKCKSKGSKVAMPRKNQHQHELNVTRSVLVIPNVVYRILRYRDPKGGRGGTDGDKAGCVGYLAVKRFTDHTPQEIASGVNELHAQATPRPLKGLVIDLRGNPGGPLEAGLESAALFIGRNKPLLQMVRFGRRVEVVRSTNRRANMQLPLLVVTDAYTASSSEIFAYALQDNLRAVAVGTKTLGKNVTQAIVRLSDGSGISLTIAEFCSPTGRSMDDGFCPDALINAADTSKFDGDDVSYDGPTSTWRFCGQEVQGPLPSATSSSFSNCLPWRRRQRQRQRLSE